VGFATTILNNTSGTVSVIALRQSLPSGASVDWSVVGQSGSSCLASRTPPSQTLACSITSSPPAGRTPPRGQCDDVGQRQRVQHCRDRLTSEAVGGDIDPSLVVRAGLFTRYGGVPGRSRSQHVRRGTLVHGIGGKGLRMSGERLCEPVGAAWTGPGRENAAAHGVPAPWGRVICERTRRPCANRRIGVSRDRGSLGMDR